MAFIYNLSDTWNDAGVTFTGIGLNVTDSASAAASNLLNLQVGGSSRFSVRKNSTLAVESIVANGSYYLSLQNAISTAGYWASATDGALGSNGAGFVLGANRDLAWSGTANNPAVAVDLRLFRDAANTLAQRNGTNAQTLRVYNTFTDASNYERLSIGYSAGVSAFVIQREQAGTGAQRALYLNGGSHVFGVGAVPSGAYTWTIAASGGHFVAGADNTYDIGASGANRPRDIYTAGKIDAGNGNLTLSNDVRLSRRSSGVLLLDNNGGTDFGRLQFGGTTSSFPALKRNGTTLETKLADDSAYAPHAMQYLDIDDGVTAPGAATGRARIYVDTADGDLKIVFADGTVKTIVTDT